MQHYNDPKHRYNSKCMTEWLKEKRIRVFPQPSRSTDFNPDLINAESQDSLQKQMLQNSKDWKIIATRYDSTVWWIDGCVWKLYLSHDCMKWHNVMRKTANEVNGGSLWLCRCTVCPIKLSWTDQKQQQLYSLTLRFNPDNAFILFWISFYFLIWLCSPIQIHVIELEFKKKNKHIQLWWPKLWQCHKIH